MNNVRFLYPKNDREEFFTSDEAYAEYEKQDEELRKIPIEPILDWRFFLKVLLGRHKDETK